MVDSEPAANADNPFAPPAAALDPQAEAGGSPASDAPVFYAIGAAKLLLLSVLTFGLYYVVWSYRQWRATQQITKASLSPFLRAWFSVLTNFSLFKRVAMIVESEGGTFGVPTTPLATCVLLGAFGGQLLEVDSPLWWVCFAGMTAPPAIIQSALNTHNERIAPQLDANRGLRGWDWLIVLVGGGFFALFLIGAMVGTEAG